MSRGQNGYPNAMVLAVSWTSKAHRILLANVASNFHTCVCDVLQLCREEGSAPGKISELREDPGTTVAIGIVIDANAVNDYAIPGGQLDNVGEADPARIVASVADDKQYLSLHFGLL